MWKWLMRENRDTQVVWVDKNGQRHETEFYPNEQDANHKGLEIIAEHRTVIKKIWLQGRKNNA